ncbi:MAG: glycoside hydrolase family 88 protein [Bacteroidales bacterium]|nr:glycoside hydrolase family 88 protein [Bacteroidales bacterium]
MNKITRIIPTLLAAVLFLTACSSVENLEDSAKLPKQKSVIQAMTITNDYFMAKWPDTGKPIVTNRERPSNIWTRGVYYEGLMAMYGITGDKKLLDYAISWGEAHQWGMRSGNRTRNADDQCCGQTYIALYQIDPKEERIANIKASIDAMVNSTKADDWNWIDALQMAMPVFAQLGVVYKDPKYFDKMYDIYMYTKTKHGDNGLYNTKEHLWWRDADYVPPYKEPDGRDCYWSRGNGWVVAALVRVLDIAGDQLKAQRPAHYEEYATVLKEMLAALIPIQRTDGYWNCSLHDPNNFGGKELSGTALFVYGMAWGVNNGLIDKKTYQPIALKAWNAMVENSIDENGHLGYVQGTGKEPKDGQPTTFESTPDFEDYGLGCFLLAGSEIYKLKK